MKVCRTASRWNLVPAQKLLPLAPTSYCSGNILDILNNIENILNILPALAWQMRYYGLAPTLHCSSNMLDILNNINSILNILNNIPPALSWEMRYCALATTSHCSGNKHPLIISRMTKFALPTKKSNILSVNSL